MSTIEFIQGKLSQSKKSLKLREQMAAAWRNGTDESWRSVGCLLSKKQRLEASEAHVRIAAKNRIEVEMFEKVLKELI